VGLSVVSQTRCRIDVFPAFALPIIRTRNWIFGIRRGVCAVDIGAMKFGKQECQWLIDVSSSIDARADHVSFLPHPLRVESPLSDLRRVPAWFKRPIKHSPIVVVFGGVALKSSQNASSAWNIQCCQCTFRVSSDSDNQNSRRQCFSTVPAQTHEPHTNTA
jgi:hypothetical protein